MSSSEERCPTCDGSGALVRGGQRYPCPTCSLAKDTGAPYLAPAPSSHVDANALGLVRSAAYVVGAVAFFAVLALLVKALWH